MVGVCAKYGVAIGLRDKFRYIKCFQVESVLRMIALFPGRQADSMYSRSSGVWVAKAAVSVTSSHKP